MEPEYDDDFEELEDDCEFDEELDDELDLEFANPGGHSALRAETPTNPRIYPCPTCHTPNVLTRKDVERQYQCDRCADQAERGV